jgi:mono/diheme cytochrome c family protein
MSSYQPDQQDLDRLHASTRRENPYIKAGDASTPPWVILAVVAVALFAGVQLGGKAGSFTFLNSNPYEGQGIADNRLKPKVEEKLDPLQKAMKNGASSYAVCGGCHQTSGAGIAGQFPPLAGSEWVMGGTERLIRVVQHGLVGQVTVKGQNYNVPGGMMGFGAGLSNEDLANVLTYIRNSWGNQASVVTKEMVAKVRKETADRATQWTAAELEKFAKADVAEEAAK